MKNKTNIIGLMIFMFFASLNAKTPYFHYVNGEKEYFELDTRYIFVSLANEKTANVLGLKQQAFQIDDARKSNQRTDYNKRFWAAMRIEDNLSDKAYLAKLSEIKNKGEDIIAAPYFRNQYLNGIGLSNFLYVKLKTLSDTVMLKQEAQKERAVIVRQNKFMPLWFIVSVTANSKYNAMELANRFSESGLFEHANPDLMNIIKKDCSNDSLFGSQWGLSNTGQLGGTVGGDVKACNAWQVATGSGVIVAVVDGGIYLDHPDLIANTNSALSYNATTGVSPQDAIYNYGYHGTMCAGIIGAARNTIGIAGVAPDSKLMSIAADHGLPTFSEALANGIRWAVDNGADVISNSWSSPSHIPVIADAINYAVTQGRLRNGVRLGCVVVGSSGNNNASTVNFPARLPNVIAVGAVDRCGIRSGNITFAPNSCDPWPQGNNELLGSAFGADLDVVAPGTRVHTTNPPGRYPEFSGTSAAAPHVAGAAALILSFNPNLTHKQVKDIIELTAQKINTYTYFIPADTSRRNGTWNQLVGYGLLDAGAAVEMARSLCMLPSTYSGTTNVDTTVYGGHITT
ncbi:MAG: S8 family serine peptidase, partial [Treponema sp.]|nr:S8 family serine peptidase [Treponema sp.]